MFEKLKFWKKSKRTRYPLKVKNLYGGPRNLIQDVTFKVRKRDTFAIVGPSGSGKTTLMKIILELFNKTSGDINAYGKSVGKVKKKMAFCPQHNSFFGELTVRENIILFGSLNGLSKEDSLAMGTKYLKELELLEKLDDESAILSGGQKTRLNLILSVLHKPKLIFLDEPFTGLDYYNRSLLWAFIKRRKKEGSTVVLTTHLLTEAQKNCNRMLVIKEGKKFVMGDVEDIRQKVDLDFIIEIKFKRLSKKKMKAIDKFCKIHEIDILSKQVDVLWFGVDEKTKKKLDKFLKKFEHKKISVREPEINDLFLKVAEE